MNCDAVVIGAGVGGLTLAYHLQQAGLKVMVLEAQERIGGVINTEQHSGFLLEHGPNSSLSKPAWGHLIEQLGLSERMIVPRDDAKNRFLAISGRGSQPNRIVAAPMGPLQALKTPLLSTSAKLRLLGDLFASAGTSDDEDVHSFVTRHFGLQVTEQIVAPMLGGIWAANISALSCRSALPMLWSFDQECGSIIRGGIKHIRNKPKKPKKSRATRAKLASFENGMAELPQALAAALKPDSLLLSSPVAKIEQTAMGVRVHYSSNGSEQQLIGRQVIITTPAKVAAAVIEKLDSDLAGQMRGIPYAPLGVMHLAYDRSEVQHPLNGFGFLVPPKLNYALLGAIFSSSLFANRAPAGKHLLTCFVGGAAKPELADVSNQEIQQRVISELNLLIQSSSTPQLLAKTVWGEAIPNYPLQHYRLQKAIAQFETQYNGIRFLGNWLRGISVVDRLEQAALLANHLIENHNVQRARAA